MHKSIYILFLTILVACTDSKHQPAEITSSDIIGYYDKMPQYEDYTGISDALESVDQQIEIRSEGHIIFHTVIGQHAGGHASLQRWEMSGDILSVYKPNGMITHWKVEKTSYGLRLSNDTSSMLLQKVSK